MKIESILQLASQTLVLLSSHRERTLQRGIREDDLPRDAELRAIALLGEHDRRAIVATLREHWQMLVEKGLVRGEINEASTPLLRFLAFVVPHIESVDCVWDELNNNHHEFPEPLPELLKCVDSISRVYWGQPLQIRFQIRDIERVLISCSPSLGLDDAFLQTECGRLNGTVNLLADQGWVRFVLLASDGTKYTKAIPIALVTSVEEIFA